jgi:acyl carrier protein
MAELPAGELEPLLEELTDASVDSARFAELVGELQKLFDRHVQRQQTKFFPELRAVLPEDDLVSLGQRMSQPPS